jgi:ParB/RepB/Spo0J family partition protein
VKEKEVEKMRCKTIPASRIKPNPLNPRVIFKPSTLTDLAENIKEHGGHPFNPILVRPLSDGYEVVCGHTRLKALTEVLGRKELVVGEDLVVRPMDDRTALRVMVDDNIKRWRYQPAELATALKLLLDCCGLSVRELGRQYGVDESRIRTILKIAKLPDRLQRKVQWGKQKSLVIMNNQKNQGQPAELTPRPEKPSKKGVITPEHAKYIADMGTNEGMVQVGLAVEKHNLSVVETKQVTKLVRENPSEPVVGRAIEAAVHAVQMSNTNGVVNSLVVEFDDPRIAQALSKAAKDGSVSPEEYACAKVVEGLINDGYLRPEILRKLEYKERAHAEQNDYREWFEDEGGFEETEKSNHENSKFLAQTVPATN